MEESRREGYRVLPGALAVSRAFGDVETKYERFGGCADVIISTPSVCSVQIGIATDFLVLACDGIWDKLSNEIVVQTIWNVVRSDYVRGKTFHDVCGECANAVLRAALLRQSLDNVTVIFVAFKNFKRCVKTAVAKAQPVIPLTPASMPHSESDALSPAKHVTFAQAVRNSDPV